MTRDKGLHLLAGAAGSLGAYAVWAAYGDQRVAPLVVAISSAVALGALKEALDPLWGGRRDLADLLYTVAGGVVAALLGRSVMLAF